ncbi:MAG TPA: hypothetical protein DCM87_09535 [Planctomycetes bacterium]|nr:hypothetical protein [Planctomycetota bacterium]
MIRMMATPTGYPTGRESGVTRGQALRDVLFVLGLCVAYVVLELLAVPKRWTFAGVGVALAAFGVVRVRSGTESWRDLGLRMDNLLPALGAAGLFTALAATGIAAYAVLRNVPLWRSDMALLLPLYPVWGIVQQTIFQGVLHRRLRVVLRSAPLEVAVTSVAFGLVHWGNMALVVLTLAAGICWSLLFRCRPNTWALGLSHGALAALAYPLVLGEAPLGRI